MKIVIAPDSFKESLSALEVAEQIEVGVPNGLSSCRICEDPMADGGEGTMEVVGSNPAVPTIFQSFTALTFSKRAQNGHREGAKL